MSGGPRPRDIEPREDIQRVVLDLVASHGLGGVTIDAVASAARVSKSTMYRRWPTKTDLILEAIRMSFDGDHHIDPGDLGSLRAELRIVLDGAAAALRQNRRLMIALLDAAQRDPEVFALMRHETRDRLREATERPLVRAIARGDIPPETNLDLIPQIALPILHFRAIWNEPIDDAFLDQLLDGVLLPVAATPAPPAPASP